MFQVTCIHDRPPAQVHLGPVAVQLKLRIILGTLHMVITLTPVILSVRIKEEKATKVGMPPAPLNPSKALISKSGPPHDHFNWPVMERCAEWLGLARGLFHITYLKRKKKYIYIKNKNKKNIYKKKDRKKKRKKKKQRYCALIVRICARFLGHSLVISYLYYNSNKKQILFSACW